MRWRRGFPRHGFLTLMAATVLVALAVPAPASAQDASKRPVRVVSAFPAGTGPDVAMRLLGEQVAKQGGRHFVIEAIPGGNGVIAVSALKRAPADGNTLLLVSNAHLSIVPALMPNAPYSVQRDMVPVATLYSAPFFLAVSANSGFRNLQELLAKAKAEERGVSYSIAYFGAAQHLGIEVLGNLVGARMLPVPYKDGGLTSVAKGEVDFNMTVLNSVQPFVEAGKVRVLAVSSLQRSELMPDVPTVQEAGGPKGYQAETFVGLMAPRGTPASVIQEANDQIARALRSPELIERYKRAGVSVLSSTPAQMLTLMQDDAARVAEQVRRTGIKVE
jgi:tripartite-type tricarboxylate transporter receptor subunit TctC